MSDETFYDDWAEEMCVLVDELAKKHISTDTPLFTFQQSMVSICRKYRKEKAENESNLER